MSTPSTSPSVDPQLTARLAQAVQDQADQVLADLVELARIPSISLPAFDPQPVHRSAEAVARLLQAAGMSTDVVCADGLPAVIGHLPGPPGAPTVLLYAHHDVQPPGSSQDWLSPPFQPERRGERLYGRGVADDKAGVMVHIAALRAHQQVCGGVPVSVTVLVEGEEEAGSQSLSRLLDRHHQRLDCDVLVLADSVNWAVGVPALTTTLRGSVRLTVTVRTLRHSVHSGMYGGPAPDALTAMCRLVASCHRPDGQVAVPGLVGWDAGGPPYPEADFRADAGLLDGVTVTGTGSLTSRLWTQPTVTVIGIDAPPVDEAANVLQPACRAKLSVRLAPSQDPDEAARAVAAHLQAHAPWGAQVEVVAEDQSAGFQAPTEGPYPAAAREALAQAWGRPAVQVGIGGSIPFIAEFCSRFPSAAVLVTGVEDPDTRAHGANESLHLAEFRRACLAETLFLQHCATARSGDGRG